MFYITVSSSTAIEGLYTAVAQAIHTLKEIG